jgi:hypothetical protein
MKWSLGLVIQLGTLLVTLGASYASLKQADAELRESLRALRELQEVQMSFMRSWDAELSSRIDQIERRVP